MFDYCTPAEAFAYGASAGSATDPVNEASVMATIVTAVSRAIDAYCEQTFYQHTQTIVLFASVYPDTVLTCHPPTPVITSVTAVDVRAGGEQDWTPITLSNVETFDRPFGALLRVYGDFARLRRLSPQARVTYTGGYANLAALPMNLRWAAQALAWWTYTRRSAPQEMTAAPELGIVVRPGQWPDDIRRTLNHYKRVVA